MLQVQNAEMAKTSQAQRKPDGIHVTCHGSWSTQRRRKEREKGERVGAERILKKLPLRAKQLNDFLLVRPPCTAAEQEQQQQKEQPKKYTTKKYTK